MNHHHSANAVVAKMAVRTVEMNNESAASLIQSVTVHIFQSAPLPRVPVVVQQWPMSGIGLAIYRGRITEAESPGAGRSIKFHNSPNRSELLHQSEAVIFHQQPVGVE